MATQEKMDKTTQKQMEEIEGFKKHPLWPKFREKYQEMISVDPEKTAVPVLVMNYWNMFLHGAQASKEFEVNQQSK